MVISAGGYFVKRNDTLDYQGGETRLVSIPAAAKFQDLVDSLDRVASGSITSASSIGLGQVCWFGDYAGGVLCHHLVARDMRKVLARCETMSSCSCALDLKAGTCILSGVAIGGSVSTPIHSRSAFALLMKIDRKGPCGLQVSAMKYQLPSDPSVYVDVVDDEDVSLMLDEWREASAAATAGSNPSRLHIFVQWCAPA